MIPRECRRLAEVDFPIAVVSKHAAKEKSIRHGHPSTLHLWWARRPLASSRAVLMALLLPDPCDSLCPEGFKREARRALLDLRARPTRWTDQVVTDEGLRKVLLEFIGDFSDWDVAADPVYLACARRLVRAAHPEGRPLVVDPFAGGGSIPLEALRLECDAFSSDLNPVACLILKVMLDDVPKHGPRLADELRRIGAEIKRQAERELADLYPTEPDGAIPIAYLWARTVRCESPNCGAEIPLVRSFWLSKKANRLRALRARGVKDSEGLPRVEFEIFEPKSEKEVSGGTVSRARATCLCCGAVLPPERVRAQLADQRGGADVNFDREGRRAGGSRLLAVVTLKPGEQGRHYRLASHNDYEAIQSAQSRLRAILADWERGGRQGICPVPDEPTPVGGGAGAGRAFSLRKYGLMTQGDIFTARQKLALMAVGKPLSIQGELSRPVSLALGKLADLSNVFCPWEPIAECPRNVLSNGRIKPAWDFAEGVVTSDSSGSFAVCVENLAGGIASIRGIAGSVDPQVAAAQDCPLPSGVAAVWFTDPPYYDAIPYSDLSDVFFVWYRRCFPDDPLFRDPFDSANQLTPKCPEAIYDDSKFVGDFPKDKSYFEGTMAAAFQEGRRVLSEDGVASVVFAHKTTEGWEALIGGIIRGGWTVTGSWPIATEQAHRLRARDSAALGTSVHLVCRPRPMDASVGDWGDVLRELPKRVADWMQRLQREGVRGADLVFACIGPALEVFSRYSKVETAEGREVELPGFLEKVWEAVGRAALAQVLGGGNGGAAAVEEDARLTALFLWTLQSTSSNGQTLKRADQEDEDLVEGEDEGEELHRRGPTGLRLIYDVVRRFAQPLGIRLEDWEGRIIQTEKGVVRLLAVGERADQLFGKDGAQAVADQIETRGAGPFQLPLIPPSGEPATPQIRGQRNRGSGQAGDGLPQANREATTLDRVHAAMLLQASGRANALRALLKAELERGPEFLRLANALSALYPRESEEKRLLDAMLLAVPR